LNRNLKPSIHATLISFHVRKAVACLTVLVSLCTGSKSQTPSEVKSQPSGSSFHVTHVLGFEGSRHNATGDLRIQRDALQFQRDGSPIAQVNLSSIQEIFVEDEDKQVGGMAMTLGKAAVPYGGGRVVSLFSHKKYDVLTLEYLDSSGGLHNAIFQLNKGQGQILKTDLIANGAHASSTNDRTAPQSALEIKHEDK
jgi:hypothetical protein